MGSRRHCVPFFHHMASSHVPTYINACHCIEERKETGPKFNSMISETAKRNSRQLGMLLRSSNLSSSTKNFCWVLPPGSKELRSSNRGLSVLPGKYEGEAMKALRITHRVRTVAHRNASSWLHSGYRRLILLVLAGICESHQAKCT
jgi:hypothetical protein